MRTSRFFFAATLAAASLSGLPALGATFSAGDLVRASGPAVYYYASNGKRYVFPNEQTYKTWYADFSTVKVISDAELAAIAIGGNVTYKPGTRMVKIVSDPKAYAVDAGGTLRHVASEAVAKALFGDDWAQKIDDVADAFFTNYRTGSPITAVGDFDPGSARGTAGSIAVDKGLASSGAAAVSSIDLTKLPLGDNKYSSSAKQGYVYSCQTSYNNTQAGAGSDGPWISGSTWDATKKLWVDGSVSWPTAAFTITKSGANRVLSGNILPLAHTTGTYPIASSDDAYAYDRNPNAIKAQSPITITLPIEPTVAATPTCVGGEVGISVSGVAIFNGFDAGGRDAVAHEVQDSCDGHPQVSGLYHYHGPSSCVATGDSELFGYAFDGFGIYSNIEKGKSLTNADLDECHGHTGEIVWEGATKSMYHYHLTNEFPYTVGCFRGAKKVTGPLGGGGGVGGMGGPGGLSGYPPPPRMY